jgi:spermidine/putrescine transport system substrate-binding protein
MSTRTLLVTFVAPILVTASTCGVSASETLYLFNWTDYIPSKLLEKFENETGIKVVLDTYTSNGTLLAKIEAGGGGYDVAVPSATVIPSMIASGKLLEIDAKQMPNFHNVRKPFDTLSGDPERKYTVPYTWGMTGIVYDSDKVSLGQNADSWKSVFEPEASLRGRIGMPKQDGAYNAAAYYVGASPCTDSVEDAQKIYAVLDAQKPYVKLYADGGWVDRIVAGEVDVALMINGDFRRAQRRKPSLRFVIPKEGVGVWMDNFVVLKSAQNVTAAKTFMNWMLEPENAAAATNFTGDGSAVSGIEPYVSEEMRADATIQVPDSYADRLKPLVQCSATANDLRSKVRTKLMQ